METKKTISFLNSKAWYRFLKVVFIFIFIAVILIANGTIINEGIGQIDKDKTLIYCNGEGYKILTAKQAGVYFGNNDFIKDFNYQKFYKGYYNEHAIEDILRVCYDGYDKVKNNNIYLMQRVHEIVGFKDRQKKYNEDYLKEQFEIMIDIHTSKDQKISYLDYSIHLFDIKPVYTYKNFISHSLIANFSILLIFEVLRRVFYYIVFGIIKPKK